MQQVCASAPGECQGSQSHLRGLLQGLVQQRLLERLQPVRMHRCGLDFALGKITQRVAEFQLFDG
jgi:hypothetical protein